MKLIKIIRESIKPNPKAGQTQTRVMGDRQISFTIKGKLPEHLIDGNGFDVLCFSGEEINGVIIVPDLVDEFLKIPNCTVKIEYEHHIVNHTPAPEYLYSYENPLMNCSNCEGQVKLGDIGSDSYDDEPLFTICPICKAIDTFEDFEFENINNIIK